MTEAFSPAQMRRLKGSGRLPIAVAVSRIRVLPVAVHLCRLERAVLNVAVGLLSLFIGVALVQLMLSGRSDVVLGLPFEYVAAIGSVVTTLIVVLRVVRVPEDRGAWAVFAAGLGLYMLGSVLWWLLFARRASPPVPSIADALWFSFYASSYVALMRLAWSRGRQVPTVVWIDGVIAGLGTATVGAAIGFAVVDPASVSRAAAVTDVVYPIADLLVVVLVVGIPASRGWRLGRAWTMIAASFLLSFAADTMCLIDASRGQPIRDQSTTIVFGLAMLLLALAAWQPKARSRTLAAGDWGMFVVPVVLAASAPAVLVWDHFQRLNTATVLLAAVTLAACVVRAGFSFRDLRAVDRLKDDLLNAVSHEFRTPLTSIRGHLRIAQRNADGGLGAQQQQSLAVIERNSARLLRLVDDLLLAAQVDCGHFKLQFGQTDLARLTAESVEAAAPIAQRKGVALRLRTPSDLPAVWADPVRLAQVLDNLIGNAVKFTEQGGTVTVRTTPRPHHVRVEIADTGIGIARNEQPSLFARFARATSATSNEIAGTGLGLYLAHTIVTAHAGTIDLDSAPGTGTTIRIELPTAAHGPSSHSMIEARSLVPTAEQRNVKHGPRRRVHAPHPERPSSR